jgi:orotidine-5'-phosphate decarboxylase
MIDVGGTSGSDARERLIVALDFPSLPEALALVDALGDHVLRYKVGLELFAQEGPNAVRALATRGKRVFLDLKLHDIPETVKRAARQCALLGADLVTVHASGGASMLKAAVDGAASHAPSPLVLAVTVLTSMTDEDLALDGHEMHVGDLVTLRAQLAWETGVRGFVASPLEVAAIRAALPAAWVVTPGIRPHVTGDDDQKRTATARAAREAGADAIVVGRPVRDAQDPVAVVRALLQDLN